MYSLYESKIVRSLGVIAFAAAFLAAIIITFNSGILGDNSGSSSSSSAEALDSAVAATPGEASAAPEAAATTGTRTHVVADGDSFYSIARKYDITIADIQRLNPNVDPQNLTAGLKLSIP